jgi:hypothetical protein
MFMEMDNRSQFRHFSRYNPYRLSTFDLKFCLRPAVLFESTGGARKTQLRFQDLPGFTTGSAGLFDLTLFCEIEPVAITLFTDEFGTVLPIGEIRRSCVDDLPKTRHHFFVKLRIERMGHFGSLPFVVFDR